MNLLNLHRAAPSKFSSIMKLKKSVPKQCRCSAGCYMGIKERHKKVGIRSTEILRRLFFKNKILCTTSLIKKGLFTLKMCL
jgi:hypothetical protein